MKQLMVFALLALLGWLALPTLLKKLPTEWNPSTPLAVTDPPTLVTRYKLKRLASDSAGCLAVLQRAESAGYISYTRPGNLQGQCPLVDPVRISGFGEVKLSSSFLASCALAVSSTMLVTQALKPLAQRELASPLARIDHLGSYACRNIYHRAEGRLSEHATAEAWDLSAFRLQNGQRISVLNHWQGNDARSRWLHQVFAQSCGLFGNSLGPEYNAAHANHFHLGMRGFSLCR